MKEYRYRSRKLIIEPLKLDGAVRRCLRLPTHAILPSMKLDQLVLAETFRKDTDHAVAWNCCRRKLVAPERSLQKVAKNANAPSERSALRNKNTNAIASAQAAGGTGRGSGTSPSNG